jgi:hypothetical protein
VNVNDKKEDRREYGRQYYWANREIIRQRYREQADVANKTKKIRRADLVMLQEWSNKLTERLKSEDLGGWLRWALELTRSKIIDKINDINGGKEHRKTDT